MTPRRPAASHLAASAPLPAAGRWHDAPQRALRRADSGAEERIT
ncbi:hypothetical protein ACLBKU_14975 [Erythrobacter sp. NE805]